MKEAKPELSADELKQAYGIFNRRVYANMSILSVEARSITEYINMLQGRVRTGTPAYGGLRHCEVDQTADRMQEFIDLFIKAIPEFLLAISAVRAITLPPKEHAAHINKITCPYENGCVDISAIRTVLKEELSKISAASATKEN